MVRVIPVLKISTADMGLFLKSRAGLVQRRTWVKDSTGRHGHYRMQWVAPGNSGANVGAGQRELFGEDKKKVEPGRMAEQGNKQLKEIRLDLIKEGDFITFDKNEPPKKVTYFKYNKDDSPYGMPRDHVIIKREGDASRYGSTLYLYPSDRAKTVYKQVEEEAIPKGSPDGGKYLEDVRKMSDESLAAEQAELWPTFQKVQKLLSDKRSYTDGSYSYQETHEKVMPYKDFSRVQAILNERDRRERAKENTTPVDPSWTGASETARVDTKKPFHEMTIADKINAISLRKMFDVIPASGSNVAAYEDEIKARKRAAIEWAKKNNKSGDGMTVFMEYMAENPIRKSLMQFFRDGLSKAFLVR